MRIAVLDVLPFHGWVLDGLFRSLAVDRARLDLVVRSFQHAPTHGHDWFSTSSPTAKELTRFAPDIVVVADMPFEPIRAAVPAAKIVTVRHSLASRGNTWDPELAKADHIAIWSTWDLREFERRRLQPRLGFLRSGGPVWADKLAGYPAGPQGRDVARSQLFRRFGSKDFARPIVAWAPSLNETFSRREVVLSALESISRLAEVVVRPHYATSLREKEWLASLNFKLDDSLADPAMLLTAADVLISDVSGIALMATLVPGARLPIVQIDPPDSARAGVQYDPTGPEWVFRDEIGPRISENEPAAAIRRAVLEAFDRPDNGLRERAAVAFRLCEGVVGGASARLANKILELA